MLPRLPIFPLSVVLFPGTTLPLHIFEPRYRRMLSDCLAGDRRFGITPMGSAGEAPERGTVGCVAEIRVNQELPDGRSNIVVLGGLRFVIQRLVPDAAPYLVAVAQTFDDDTDSLPPEDRAAHLRAVFLEYQELRRHLHDLEPEDAELPADAVGLSFHAAAGADCDLSIKRGLLIERSTARRVESLLLLLPVLTSAAEKALDVHRRAHTNGKGGAPSGLAAGS
jgi:ATP-dependent Lon protease